MTSGTPSTIFLVGLLRIAMAVVVFAVSVTMWAPNLASGLDQAQGASVTVGHPAHHGSPSEDASEKPRHAWACAFVCAGGETCCPDVVSSSPLRMVASAAPLSRDDMRDGQSPDPALRPPRFEAIS